jgi:hypothetical protein
VQGVALGTVVVRPDAIEASAETAEDLEKLVEFLEACLRGLIERVPTDAIHGGAPAAEPGAPPTSAPAGTAFIRRMLECWPDVPQPGFSERTPREVCRSQSERDEAAHALLALERDMARQKRLGRAWGDVGPLWERLGLAHPSPAHAPAGVEAAQSVGARERRAGAKR